MKKFCIILVAFLFILPTAAFAEIVHNVCNQAGVCGLDYDTDNSIFITPAASSAGSAASAGAGAGTGFFSGVGQASNALAVDCGSGGGGSLGGITGDKLGGLGEDLGGILSGVDQNLINAALGALGPTGNLAGTVLQSNL